MFSETVFSFEGTWTTTSSMAVTRTEHTASVLLNGKVLVAGGYGTGPYINSAEIYDPSTGTYSSNCVRILEISELAILSKTRV